MLYRIGVSEVAVTTGDISIGAVEIKDANTDDRVAVSTFGEMLVEVSQGRVDDSPFTVGVFEVLPIGALADETAPDSVNEGDIGIPRMTLDRKLLVRLVGANDSHRADVDSSGNLSIVSAPNGGVDIGDVTINNTGGAGAVNIQDGGNSITVDITEAKVDDSVFVVEVDKVFPMGALADETAPDSVNEGDIGIPRMTLDRKLLTRIVGDSDGNRANVNSSSRLLADTTITGVGSKLSTLNSSVVTLGISSTFTGTFEEVLDFAHITIFVFANVASAVDGLKIDWSQDGVTVDRSDVFSIPANNGRDFTFGPFGRYFRIRYVNGVVAQTTFKLQVILKCRIQKASSHRIQDSILVHEDAELVKSILSAEDANNPGTFVNIKVDSDGKLLISTAGVESEGKINVFARTVVTSFPHQLISYTVPADRFLLINTWNMASEGSAVLSELQVATVPKDAIRITASSIGERITAFFNNTLKAEAGQVVRVQLLTGIVNKEYIGGFNGLELDVV